MGVYDRQIAQATKKIKVKGELVIWNKHVVVTDPTKPWKTTTSNAPVTFPVFIVFKTPKASLGHELIHLMQGTSVPEGGPGGLMAAVPFTPEADDTVLKGTETLMVKSIDIVAPNGDPILYKIEFA